MTSAIPGVTLNLLEKNSASTITVTIGQSVDATKALVDDFVEAFTALETFIEEQGAAVGHQGPLGRGALLRSLRADIRSSLIASYPVNGRYHDLTDAGLGFDADGELTFTKATFDAAAKIALADIRKLFVGGGGQDGAFTVLQGGGSRATRRPVGCCPRSSGGPPGSSTGCRAAASRMTTDWQSGARSCSASSSPRSSARPHSISPHGPCRH